LTLVFGSEIVKILHEEVISIRGTRGIKSKGILESCLERPFMRIYKHEAFPGIFMKAAKMLHCIAGPFHPFIDGNKRTALLTVSIFLNVDGYSFRIPADVIDFTLLIAKGRIRSVRKISRWIEKSCTKNDLYGIEEERMVSISKVVNLPIGNGREVPMHLKKV
jgi:death on curing protein